MARRRARPAGFCQKRGRVALNTWRKLRARSRSNVYFALLFLDRDRREAFRDVYRFARAADDIADASASRREALEGLSALRRELAAALGGRPAHPNAARLARTAARYQLPSRHFDALLSALEADARGERAIETREEVFAYCEAVAAPIAYLCLGILGASGPAAERYARDMSTALQLAHIVRDVREDARAGRVYLPRRELRAAGGSPEALLRGAFSPAAAAVCRELADRARALIASARGELDDELARALAVPEVWADVYLAELAELERADFDPGAAPKPLVRRRRKLALALRRYARSRANRRPPLRAPRRGRDRSAARPGRNARSIPPARP